jgi:hypothetical protein
MKWYKRQEINVYSFIDFLYYITKAYSLTAMRDS